MHRYDVLIKLFSFKMLLAGHSLTNKLLFTSLLSDLLALTFSFIQNPKIDELMKASCRKVTQRLTLPFRM